MTSISRICMLVLLGVSTSIFSFGRTALAVVGPKLNNIDAVGATAASGAPPSVTLGPPSTTPHVYLALAIIMFLGGAALAAAETAITTLWPWKVRELAAAEGERSPFAMLESDLTRFLTTILVATTSATIFSTAIATDFAARIFGNASVAYVTFTLTVFFLFFGEILPKALAVHSPARVARFMVPYIRGLSLIVFPIGKLLASVSSFILRVFNLQMESDVAVSEQELRLIVAGADRSGSIEKYESQIIRNVLDLEEMYVREVMIPRVDIVAIEEDSSLQEFLKVENESKFSRIPVFDETVDNITGVVYAKSILECLYKETDIAEMLGRKKVKELARGPYFVPESMSVWNVLEEMRKRELHLAIVVDEYGGTSGLVTLEDILEEIIYDECDDIEDTVEEEGIREVGKENFEIDGQADLDLVAEVLGIKLDEEDLKEYGTISGYLCDEMDGIPDVGEEIVVGGVRFRVTQADDRRILMVNATKLSEEELQALVDVQDSQAGTGGSDTERDTMSKAKVVKVNESKHVRDTKALKQAKDIRSSKKSSTQVQRAESNGGADSTVERKQMDDRSIK